MISRERLKELLCYDPETGSWCWLQRPSNRIKVGDRAGTLHTKSGYRRVQLDGCAYELHRLAFLYMTGEIPAFVDHKDRDRGNCAWRNLRAATRNQNGYNRGVQSNNTTGVRGVVRRRKGRFQAQIKVDGKYLCLGQYATIEEASAVRQDAAVRLHGKFAGVA